MTREEAIKMIRNDMELNYCTWSNEETEAVKMAIEALAQPEQQWIPISERQPKRCDYYIVTDSDSAGEAYYGSDRRWWADGNKLKDVTAWMPLPEPYKEG